MTSPSVHYGAVRVADNVIWNGIAYSPSYYVISARASGVNDAVAAPSAGSKLILLSVDITNGGTNVDNTIGFRDDVLAALITPIWSLTSNSGHLHVDVNREIIGAGIGASSIDLVIAGTSPLFCLFLKHITVPL